MLKIREPGSAITHFVAMLFAIIAAAPLLIKASSTSGYIHIIAMSIFILSMILLYGASTTYHSINLSQRIIKTFRKIDHMMIFVLIAGSYTPVCMIVLGGTTGYTMLAVIWGIALLGIILKGLWITCPKWFSSLLYIAMGWTCIFAFAQIKSSLSQNAFLLLLAGGIVYTVGGILYALKFKGFNAKHISFGSHEIFHLFVLVGSACHFIFMYQFIATMPLS